jgi:hypothetical protein
MRSARGFHRGREFGQPHALFHRLVDMVERGVIMAGERYARAAAVVGNRLAVWRRVAVLLFLAHVDVAREGLVGEPALGLVVEGVLTHGLKLALARRMIHERG